MPKSTPVEQKDARPGSMVDQIVGRSDTTMRNTDDTTSIDIDVLHRIAKDWYQRLRLHEIDDSTIQIEATAEGLKVVLFYGDDEPMFEESTPRLTNHGRKVIQRMSWLLSQHVLVYRIDSHTNNLNSGKGLSGENAWEMSLLQGKEIAEALSHYSANELDEKLERITGHGFTKPNNTRSKGIVLLACRPESRLSTDFWAMRSSGSRSCAVRSYKSATFRTRPALTSWATVSFPRPSMFIALREMK